MNMNDAEMLKNIEYLRERSDVSYEEAQQLLERYDGNLMRVLVELERQGRVRTDPAAGSASAKRTSPAREKTTSTVSNILRYRVVVENKKGSPVKPADSKKSPETIANLSAVYCGLATVFAPHVMLGSVALMFALGYRVRVAKRPPAPLPQDVNSFVDQTVSNIKTTASSFAETAHTAVKGEEEDENEVTIE